MDWENERYVRFYTRRTADDLALCWQARAIWPHLLAVADRAGYIHIKQGERRLKLLAGLLLMPIDLIQAGLPDLLEDGRIREIVAGYFIPNYMEAQEAKSSDGERQRRRRERLRDQAMAELSVTKRDDVSRNVTTGVTASQNVTGRHAQAPAVTPSLAVPSLAVPPPPFPPPLRLVEAPSPKGEEEEGEKPFHALFWQAAQEIRLEEYGLSGELKRPRDYAHKVGRAVANVGEDGLVRAYRRFLEDPEFSARGWPMGVFLHPNIYPQRAHDRPTRDRLTGASLFGR